MVSASRAGRQAERGFTLIELLVVTAIMTLISGLILINNNKFGGRILLENLAYDVALSVRQAQVYGISVHRFGTNTFSAGYGMHFDRLSGANPSITYELFADAYPQEADGSYGNGLYEADQGELVQSTDIERGFHVIDLCVTPSQGAAETCSINSLDIMFKRPEPDAYISANGTSGVIDHGALNQRGRVIFESPRGDRVSVVVEASGQISVE